MGAFPIKKLAFIISRLLGPLTMVCLIWLVTAVKSGIGFWKAVWVYPLIFFTSIAIPITITTYLVAVGKVESLEWKRISDRRRYGIPVTLVALASLLFLTWILTNATIFHLTLLFAVIILCTATIYSFSNFKVSAHIILSSIAFATVNLFFQNQFLWIFLLLIPIAWARQTLKIHTWPELLAGLFLANGLMLLALLLFGWPAVP